MKRIPFLPLIPALVLIVCQTAVFAQIPGEPKDLTNRRWYTLLRDEMPSVVVNGATITHGDLEERMKTLRRADYFAPRKKYDGMKPGEYRDAVRDLLIDEVVAVQEAAKLGIQIDMNNIAETADAFLGEDTKESRLKTLRTGYRDETLLDGMAKNVVINRLREEVCRSMQEPTLAELHAFYESHREVFESTPERVLARYILIRIPEPPDDEDEDEDEADEEASRDFRNDAYRDSKARADDLLERLKEGADFKGLADRNTEDSTGIGKGGALGWVHRGKLRDLGLEKLLFALEPGSPPDQVHRVDFGFAIAQVEAREPAAYLPFEAVVPRVRNGLQLEYFKDWLEVKRKNADIDYYENLPMVRLWQGEEPRKTDLR